MLEYAIHKVILYGSLNLLNVSFSYLIQTHELWEVVPATTTLWLLTPTDAILLCGLVSPVGTMSAAVSLNASGEDVGRFYALILMSVVPLSYLLMRKGGMLSVQQSVAQKQYEIIVIAHRMAPFLPELRLKKFSQSGACHLLCRIIAGLIVYVAQLTVRL